MNRSVLLVSFALVLAFCSSALAQASPAPPGAGDRNIGDTNIKDRSIELERVKQDAEKPDSKKQDAPRPAPPANFQQVKEDFEAIQKLQDDIIGSYSKRSVIDYARISLDAAQLHQSAARLESNLFPPPPPEKKKDNKKPVEQTAAQPDQPLPTDVKSLIVQQDNCIGSFVTNPMFTNPQVVDQASNVKAHADLEMLIRLSTALQQEADKLKK